MDITIEEGIQDMDASKNEHAHSRGNATNSEEELNSSIYQRKDDKYIQHYRRALFRTLLMINSAFIFAFLIWIIGGKKKSMEFTAAYLVELSLSVDNLFVFIMLFDYFLVPAESQNRVLSWGITGAICMRGVMILIGVELLKSLRWMILIFAVILLFSACKLFTQQEEENIQNNFVVKISKKIVGATDQYDGDHFFTKQEINSETGKSKWLPTPLFLCLVCIELSDVVFAIDSIPACLGVSHDLLVIYSSNLFAIACLRSLFLIVARAVTQLSYLKPAVALVLGFVSIKMIAEFFHEKISTSVSLAIVVGILAGGIIFSLGNEWIHHLRQLFQRRLNENSEYQEVRGEEKQVLMSGDSTGAEHI